MYLLAGVVASVIFIQNQSLLYWRMFICLEIIILFKDLSTHYFEKKMLQSWLKLLSQVQPGPPISTVFSLFFHFLSLFLLKESDIRGSNQY